MTILDIYHHHRIPKNLQRHMLRVAAVGLYLAENWSSRLDTAAITRTLLLHDLGNVLKFDLSKGLDLLDPEERDAEFWQAVQSDMKKRYSDNEHEATFLLARETGASERVLFLVQHMGSSHLAEAILSQDWEHKLCTYADFRVAPFGFVTVQERFRDILRRYEGRAHDLANKQATLQKMEVCLALEKQIQAEVKIDISSLPEQDLEKNFRVLETMEV